MFIFCLCDVGYWIRVNTVQKVKRKNMLPKYVGSFTAEARTVYFLQISSPFRRVVQYTRTESGRLRYASTRLAGSPMARDLENKRITRVMS